MKQWMNILFNIMCFFILVWVIYRLAMCVPPLPGEEAYPAFVLKSGGIAVVIAGAAVFPSFLIDLYLKDRKKDMDKPASRAADRDTDRATEVEIDKEPNEKGSH